MTAVRPVNTRAILIAFSTASEPELNRALRFSPSPGVKAFRRSQTATYSSYGVTMKHVWVKSSTWDFTADTTRGAELPTVVTAIPEPRSIRWLPSTSTRMPPPARSTYTGSPVPTPAETADNLRFWSSSEQGPGIAVTRIRRCSTCRGWTGTVAVSYTHLTLPTIYSV